MWLSLAAAVYLVLIAATYLVGLAIVTLWLAEKWREWNQGRPHQQGD